ncbi:hypothetical protein [Vulgatibacter sp.]|uniref:hypothetical protein n=1 Tax=Vulgatibacter sp. TaxID=1971226 RepID=UPI003568747C
MKIVQARLPCLAALVADRPGCAPFAVEEAATPARLETAGVAPAASRPRSGARECEAPEAPAFPPFAMAAGAVVQVVPAAIEAIVAGSPQPAQVRAPQPPAAPLPATVQRHVGARLERMARALDVPPPRQSHESVVAPPPPEEPAPPAVEERAPALDLRLAAAPTASEPAAPQQVRFTAPLPPPQQPEGSGLLVLGEAGTRLHLDTGESGALSVRIEVRDGAADLRAAGPAAHLLATHSGDLRVALAAEGLRLGTLETGSDPRSGSGSGGGAAPQHERDPPSSGEGPLHREPPAPPPPSSSPARHGRLHVKA